MIFIFFPIADLKNVGSCNVIQQIKKCGLTITSQWCPRSLFHGEPLLQNPLISLVKTSALTLSMLKDKSMCKDTVKFPCGDNEDKKCIDTAH